MIFEFAKQFLRHCHKFLVIGSSGLDKDLLAVLSECLDRQSRPLVHFVGEGNAAIDAQTEFSRGVDQFRAASNIEILSSGFRRYVLSEEFKAFTRR